MVIPLISNKRSDNYGNWTTYQRTTRTQNWSQDELAEILNISRQSISKWELNKVYPSIDMLIK